ncbi:hypothetical protein CVT24_012982 [Panaeolus cyanescens]|uniref:BD-FAE-like domain-containing protein n=1 Tax=Panaeolus cyanescens TaxID=181874 RepID=A0A409WA72_9AGAR|nr:hypothetical protein CVT24_012982 [Panaeolus cyanescens]
MTVSLNINYTDNHDDPLRQFDLYLPQIHNNSVLICFIHGGAWRSEDKKDHAQLAHSLVTATGYSVAVPNYRLTPPDNSDSAFHHPLHASDVHRFLDFVLAARDLPSSFILIGHSCSAHMLASIFLDSTKSCVQPPLRPSHNLLNAVKAIILSEGIYDLDSLVATFPDYRAWFILPAFGPAQSYQKYSVLNYPLLPNSNIRWLLLHSKGDTLIDIPQTKAMYHHLHSLDDTKVSIDVDRLTDEHDDILRTPLYVDLVAKFTASLLE